MSKYFKPLGLAGAVRRLLIGMSCQHTRPKPRRTEKACARQGAPQKGKGAKGGKGAKSPEVNADGTVTFRLPLPNLQKVELDGDFKERFTKGTIPMTKDANRSLDGHRQGAARVLPVLVHCRRLHHARSVEHACAARVRRFQEPVRGARRGHQLDGRPRRAPRESSTSTLTSTRTTRPTAGSSSTRRPAIKTAERRLTRSFISFMARMTSSAAGPRRAGPTGSWTISSPTAKPCR